MWMDKIRARRDLHLTMNKTDNAVGKLRTSQVSKTRK